MKIILVGIGDALIMRSRYLCYLHSYNSVDEQTQIDRKLADQNDPTVLFKLTESEASQPLLVTLAPESEKEEIITIRLKEGVKEQRNIKLDESIEFGLTLKPQEVRLLRLYTNESKRTDR